MNSETYGGGPGLYPLRGDVSAESGATTVLVQGIQTISVTTEPPVDQAVLTFVEANNDLEWLPDIDIFNPGNTFFVSLMAGDVLVYNGFDWTNAPLPSIAAWSNLTGDLTETQVIPFDGGTPGTPDSGISRIAAATLAIGNGTAGDYSGSLKLTNLTLTSSIVLGDFASLPAFLTSGGQSEGYPSVNYVSVVIPNGVEHNSVSAGTLFNTYCADPNIYAVGLNSSCLSTIGAYGIYSQAMLASGASFGTATAFSGDVYLEDSTINNSANYGMGFGMWPHGGANNYFVGSIIYIGPPGTSPYTTDLTGTVWANCYEANAAFSDPATGTSIGFYIDPETSGSGIKGATRYALKFDTTAQSAFNGVIGWQNTGLTALDTGISRLGAASLAMGNGTNGDYSGSLTLANLILSATQSPASNAAGTAGQLAYDGSFIYVCISSGVWKRAALTGGY